MKDKLQHNISLARYTSWRIGGNAQTLYIPDDVSDLQCFLKQLPHDEPLTWLGLGSNVLIRDGGINGTVIITQGKLNTLTLQEDKQTLYAQAGVSCAQAARFAARHNLTGLEFLAGIPGTIGGALAMNAGCFNGETWGVVSSVNTINRHGDIQMRQATEYDIAYRHVKGPQNEWFVAAEFTLQNGDKQTSLDTIKQLLKHRSETQPTGEHTCGSVFRNPPEHYAAKLIESCNLKGYQIGGACVSELHANFIMNKDNASAEDVEKLIEHIEKTVYEKHRIKLVREVKILGLQQAQPS